MKKSLWFSIKLKLQERFNWFLLKVTGSLFALWLLLILTHILIISSGKTEFWALLLSKVFFIGTTLCFLISALYPHYQTDDDLLTANLESNNDLSELFTRNSSETEKENCHEL